MFSHKGKSFLSDSMLPVERRTQILKGLKFHGWFKTGMSHFLPSKASNASHLIPFFPWYLSSPVIFLHLIPSSYRFPFSACLLQLIPSFSWYLSSADTFLNLIPFSYRFPFSAGLLQLIPSFTGSPIAWSPSSVSFFLELILCSWSLLDDYWHPCLDTLR